MADISRRGLLGSLVSLIGWRPTVNQWIAAPITRRRRPWADRADELEASEGHYCDYMAFKEWLCDRVEETVTYPPSASLPAGQWAAPLDSWGEVEFVAMYRIVCELLDGKPRQELANAR